MKFKKYAFLFFLSVFLICFKSSIAQIGSPKNPNIIYILTDDLGIGDVSGYNAASKIKTTNIDGLIANGVKFINAHTSSAVCTPTRYGILTGRYNWRSSMKRGVLNGYSKALIEPGRETVASFLKSQGYTTACIGKWHLGWDWNNIDAGIKNIDYSKPVKNGPNDFGFDYSYCVSGSLDMPPFVYLENGLCTEIPTDTIAGKKVPGFYRRGLATKNFNHEETLSIITNKALNFISKQANDKAPFFIYLPLTAPHTPILPTKEFKGKSGLNAYGDFVLMVDDAVKQVIERLKKEGVYENTLIVFTSDNGCSPAADFKDLLAKGHNPSWKYRGTKSDIFDGGHRVPFVVSWPEKIKQPSVADQIVCTTDFFATVAQLLNRKSPDDATDSYSFLKDLYKTDKAVAVRNDIIHHSISGEFAIKKGDWKLIMCPGSGGWSSPKAKDPEIQKLPPVQLYNIKTDIAEQQNVYAEHPEIVAELKALLIKEIKAGRTTAGAPQKNTEPQKGEGYPKWLTDL